MKKHLLLLSLAAAGVAVANAAGEKEVDFYFLDPYSVTVQPTSLLEQFQAEDYTHETTEGKNNYLFKIKERGIVVDGVTMTPGMGTNKTNVPRLFWAGSSDEDLNDIFLTDFRCYKNNTVSLSAPEGYVITKVVMHGKSGSANKSNNCDNIIIDTGMGGNQTFDGNVNTWIAGDGQGLRTVSYTVKKGAPTQAMYRMYVTLVQTSGIEEIESDADNDMPVEYFNLMGVRCDASSLAPGIYIRRCGNESVKIMVR
ncbi:MAG: hypothetical protein K2L49_09515 [Muribaculaceae bacterium]|nr:hypothetical protein [Muribaculaceae bacterium]